VFTVEERDRVREHMLERARTDARVVAGAEVGSLALGEGDRWSDLDLTFALDDEVALSEVLDDWTSDLAHHFGATQLFDLPSGPALYRVFLVPNLLQLDVSVTPASDFRPRGPKFNLLFGHADAPAFPAPPSAQELFGLATHHAIRARFSIERGRHWQAAYLIGELRNHALELACIRLALPARQGRGLDELPRDLRGAFAETLVRSLDRGELLRALDAAVGSLLRESQESGGLATSVEDQLRALPTATF